MGHAHARDGSPARTAAGIPLSAAEHPWYFPVLEGHIFFASIALAAGVIQLAPWVRRRRPWLHRRVGRIYVFAGVYPALVLAVALEVFWSFSAVTSISQWVLCALWGFVTTVGWVLRRRGRTADHRRWMYRSYAMTATSVIVVIVEPVVYAVITPEFHSRLAGSTDIFIQVSNSA